MVTMKYNITAILFDLDNTLYDHNKAQNNIMLKVTKQYPELFKNINDEAIIGAFHKADLIAIDEFNSGISLNNVRLDRTKRFLNSLEINVDISEEITCKYIQSYHTVIFPIDSAEKVIQSLSNKYKLGIVTNGSPEMQMFKLNALNILKYLGCKIFSEGLGVRKPDPEIFLAAIKVLNISPANCMFVGDSYKDDVIGAKNVGMYTCWFNPNNILAPTEIYHDIEISKLDELLNILAPEPLPMQ